MRETVICKVCLEPIFNYICVNCLELSVEKWLDGISFDLANDFKKFSENLKKQFESSFEKEKCIKCGRRYETVVCPYCYMKEIFDFLLLREETLAKNFIKFFNFDFLKVGHSSEKIFAKNFISTIISEKDEDLDINICENCGNQTDDLKEINGSYICEVCRDEIKL